MNVIPLADETAWHERRARNVGGSEVAALFGCQPEYALSHFALWQVKSGAVPRPEIDSMRARWGQRLEAVIAEGIAEDQGWTIEKGGYVEHPTVAGMACTLDYVITTGHPRCEADGPGTLEIKAVDWLVHKRQWGEEPPPHILLQDMHQLACTGFRWGCNAALIGGNQPAQPYDFDARPKIIAEIERRVAAFWQSIRDGQCPPVDGSNSTAQILKALSPEAKPGSEIDLSGNNEAPEHFANLRQARLEKKAAEAKERAAANWIMSVVKDAEIIKSDGLVIATAKTVKGKGYAVAPTSFRQLQLKEAV